ncbi:MULTISPECIES: hypothetical protein [unclassified Myxococcus]|uniref:hypothetical protein n=1 Tax=unclassified Myxococcus TaxID=2648731 RepID=UPI0020CF24A8|nr:MULTISPECIES: hypothetical protein [unclassified Myxococcus]
MTPLVTAVLGVLLVATAEEAPEGRFSIVPFVLPAAQPETSFLLGGVAFVSAATVARGPRDFDARDIKPADGVGLRFAPMSDVPVNILLDTAYGNEPGFYLNEGEAFWFKRDTNETARKAV